MKPSGLFLSTMIILCAVLTPVPMHAQENAANYLGGTFGGSDFHIKDEHASPLIFRGLGITPALQYYHRGENSRQYAEASYYYDYLGSSSEIFHTASWRGRVRYGYLQSIWKFRFLDRDCELFLGGAVGSFFTKADYFYFVKPTNGTGRTIASWYWSHSVDLAAQLEIQPAPREFLSLQLFMPVVSNVSRPEYSSSGGYNYDDNDWKVKGFGPTRVFPGNFSLDALVTYQRALYGGFNLQISYEFSYALYDRPGELGMYANNFRAGVFFCWGS